MVESEKTATGKSEEQEVVVRRRGVGKRKLSEVLNREGEFVGGGCAKLAEAALQSLNDNRAPAGEPNVREDMFELAANAREVSGNRTRLDVMGHVYNEIA